MNVKNSRFSNSQFSSTNHRFSILHSTMSCIKFHQKRFINLVKKLVKQLLPVLLRILILMKDCVRLCLENGGWGATFGVPMGRLIMEKYLKGRLSAESEEQVLDIQNEKIDYGTHKR